MEDLTSDEPYVPDDPEITEMTRSGSHKTTRDRAMEGPAWTQPKVHEGNTLLPRDPAFESRLKIIEDKMDAGTPLSEADADYAMNRAILGLFRSRRPSMRAKAVALMQNGRIKKILDTTGGKTPKEEPHGLALPGEPG